jgi:hypothetical protein
MTPSSSFVKSLLIPLFQEGSGNPEFFEWQPCNYSISCDFPLWKRGIKGDFVGYETVATGKISPDPSFPKRGKLDYSGRAETLMP